MTDKNWQDIRKEFAVCKNHVYLDHAAGGVVCQASRDAAQKFYEDSFIKGDFSWPEWIRKREAVREKIAKFINADPAEVAFVANTSTAMNYIADLYDDASVVLNTLEFPASTLAWMQHGFQTEFIKDREGVISIDDLLSVKSSLQQVIVTSLVSFKNGFRQDIEEISTRKDNRHLVVNASQAAGYIPIDVKKWDVDYLAANSYKWMLAGYGSGFLYIKKKHLENTSVKHLGWLSVKNEDLMDNKNLDLKSDARRFELGGYNFAGIFSLGAAIDFLGSLGIENIEKRVLELTAYAIHKLKEKRIDILSPLKTTQRSGIVIFRVKDNQALWRMLINKKIFVSLRGGGIRLAPHCYNSFEDIDSLLSNIP